MEPISCYVESRTELTQQQKDDLVLEISINLTGSFPYARNYMYELLGKYAPDLRD